MVEKILIITIIILENVHIKLELVGKRSYI